MGMEDDESCGSRAGDSSSSPPASQSRQQHAQKMDVLVDVVRRLQELGVDEASLPSFENELWVHFSRLPARFHLLSLSRNLSF